MADTQFTVSLFTPASDIVTPDYVNFDGLFGRKGNDTIYGDVPGVISDQKQNIDVLFGDLFDNSPQEYGTILAIQQGNPLAILNTDLPTAGADTFVVGDENQLDAEKGNMEKFILVVYVLGATLRFNATVRSPHSNKSPLPVAPPALSYMLAMTFLSRCFIFIQSSYKVHSI